MLQRVQEVLFVLLGAASLADGWRIMGHVRETATFDALGPDRYAMVIGGLMVVAGLLLAVERRVVADRPAEAGAGLWPLPDHIAMLVTLVVLALAMPVTGFVPASLAFFVLAFCWVARWNLARGLIGAALATAGLYATFTLAADVPLPRGYWGF